MDIRDILTKLTLLEGSGITPGAAGAGFKATGSQGVKPTGDLKHGMPMRLNTASPTGRAPTARLPEADVEEGNKFTGELMKARAAGKKQADLDGDGDMEPVKEAKKAKPDFLDVDGDGDKKEPFKKAVADKGRGKKAVKENLRLVRETALGDRSLRVYHDREYREYHVCVLEGDAVVSRQFAGSTAEATALVRSIVSEARGMKVAWPGSAEYKEKFGQDRESFRKKHAPSVMKSPAGREELAKLDTEYEAGKKSYGRDEEGDDEEGDKKTKPAGEKRGRGRPKGSRRAIGAKGPSGKSKLLTREDYDADEYDEEGEMAQSQSRTIADAAAELESMLDADENLPEWVQKKISLAQEYIDSARDYLAANRPEDSDEEMPLPEGSTGDYSAKKARAGRDIGKPGKNFAKIAKSAGERYGSKERGEKVAGAVLAKLRAKEDVNEADMDESALQAYLGKKKYGKAGMSALQQAGREGASKEKMANLRAQHDKLKEGDRPSIKTTSTGFTAAAPSGKQLSVTMPADRGLRPGDVKVKEQEVSEKAVSKAQRAAAGIARAAQKGEIPQSELRGASKEMAKMPAGELKKFAKTKEKGLPEKKTEEAVEETTTAGSVATAPAEGGKKSKGGIQFGKGIYEAQLAESFDAELDRVVSEGTTITINSPDSGEASVSINGTGDDAMALANLLKMAGLFSAGGYQNACSSCGQMHEGDCRVMEEDLANSADNTETMSTDYMVNGLSGGLNGPKQQVNPNNMGDNPLAMPSLGTKASPNLNLGAIAEQVERDAEDRLLDLYRKIS